MGKGCRTLVITHKGPFLPLYIAEIYRPGMHAPRAILFASDNMTMTQFAAAVENGCGRRLPKVRHSRLCALPAKCVNA